MESAYFIFIVFLKIAKSDGFPDLTINYETFPFFEKTFKGSAFKIVKNIGFYSCARLCIERSVCKSLCYEGSLCRLFDIDVAESLEYQQGSIYTSKGFVANLLMQNETIECGNSGICQNGTVCVQSRKPACVITECTELPTLESSSYLTSNDTTVGFVNKIACDYRPEGNDSIICKADGTWTFPNFTCHTECPAPPTSDFMTANSSSTIIGTAVNFTCNLPKFGSSLIICNESAQWSPINQTVCYFGTTCKETVILGGLNESLILVDPYRNGSEYSVMCEEHEGDIYTVISHNSSDRIQINGSSSINLQYELPMRIIVRLMNLSKNCKQYMNFTCFETNIFNNIDQNVGFVNRLGIFADYFPGGERGICACYSQNKCSNHTSTCNCDGQLNTWKIDQGYVTNMTDLPITRFYVLNGTSALVQIGMLMCY